MPQEGTDKKPGGNRKNLGNRKKERGNRKEDSRKKKQTGRERRKMGTGNRQPVKKYHCMSFLESSCISSRFCTFIFGSAYYSPTANGGGCGWYLEHGAYSPVGKRENVSLGGWECLGGARLRMLCLHTWRMLSNAIYGGGGSYYQL